MLPLHVFVLILMGRYSSRLYVAYSSFYAIGTLASMQVPFVGFLPLLTSEHMSSLGVFGLLQIIAFVQLVQSHVPPKQFKVLLNAFVGFGIAVAVAGLLFMTKSGKIAPWTGRFYSLWDTGYARIHLPLVSSVSEHQPTAWPSFFFDLQMLIYLFPAGVYMCFRELRDEHVFVIIYAVLASYFAGVMVRLMLTLTPVVCVAAAVAISSIYETYLDPVEPNRPATAIDESAPDFLDAPEIASYSATAGGTPSKKSKKAAAAAVDGGAAPAAPSTRRSFGGKYMPGIFGLDTRLAPVLTFTFLLLIFVLHCTWVTSTAYSSPSVVLASRNQDGSQAIIDDFREAYYWLRQNTKEDAKIMSWWDYGYQIAGFADRTTLVDNNTWNNTQCVPRSSFFIPLRETDSNPHRAASRWSARRCQSARRSRTRSCASTTSTTCLSSSAVCSASRATTSTSFSGWSASRRASGPRRSTSRSSSPAAASTRSTATRPRR